jgi:DHA1 family bicyclomycin/chloramphenicol resistance-like MFS transporter
MTPGVIVLTITLLLALQPITTDLYLPSLPTLQRELGARVAVSAGSARASVQRR